MVEQVTLRAVAWNDEAQALLARAIGNNPSYSVEELAAEVENRSSVLFLVEAGRERLGYVAAFIEEFGGGKELVLQAGAALQNDLNALRRAMPAFSRFAERNGCTSIRAHMGDMARAKMMKRAGFELAEYVVRKGV
jgi:hypothetical protein